MATAQVPHEPTLGFPPKGSLRRVPFPRLIREVARNKIDGSLYLLSGQTKKVVFFEQGQPVFVRSNVLSECLGQILAQEGLITQEQCEQTLEAIRRTGKKQGELLVEMGILSEGNLRYGLEAQLRAKLFDIFSWEEGRYQFKNDAPELTFGITLKSSAEGVIVEAIQDQYTEERASLALEPVEGKFPALDEGATEDAALALLPEERHFLACLDGSRSIRQIMEADPDPVVPTPHALLCGLLLAGLIQLSAEATERTDWPETPDLEPGGGTDEELRPSFEAQALITEYEDTPLPGEMPQSPDLLGDHEDGFEGVGEDSAVVRLTSPIRPIDVSEDLVAAEPDSIEETFDDDQIELTSDDSDVSAPPLPPLLDDPATATDVEPSSLELDAAFADLEADDDDPALGFEGDIPTSVEPPGPVIAGPAVPSPVKPTSTMPTPTDELPSIDPVPVPPSVAEPPPAVTPPVVDTAPRPPPSIDAAPPPSLTPEPAAASPAAAAPSAATPAVAPEPAAAPDQGDEGDLLDLAPDDDLLMVDENVEAVAMDLLGDDAEEPAEFGADDLALADLGSPDLLESIDPVSIDPVTLDPEAFEAEAEELEDVVEVSADELELEDGDLEEEAPASNKPAAGGDDLLDFADLDNIDLGADDEAPAAAAEPSLDLGDDLGDDLGGDVMGALRFNEGQSAVAEERWADAVALLEQAYQGGFDVAELHAMLAYARFQASGQDEHTAIHAFELLDYAQQMDPSLDLVHAYRGAIHRAQGDIPQAREALDRALELNPYCELAMEIMDAIG